MNAVRTRRIRLIMEYDGSGYVGWQTQPNGVSVQSETERSLYSLTHERIAVHASGRTDSGVHALAQTAHFDTTSRIPAEKFAYAINTALPRDIRVIYSDETDKNFHARFGVEKKHYRYSVLCTPHSSAFTHNRALHIHTGLNVDAMNEAAQIFIGTHDFSAFKAEGSKTTSAVRHIYISQWSVSGNYLHYDIAGSGFLYNMVRILAGTMLEIGRGYINIEQAKNALETGRRSLAGATAPAHGLALTRVEYNGFDTALYTQGGELTLFMPQSPGFR